MSCGADLGLNQFCLSNLRSLISQHLFPSAPDLPNIRDLDPRFAKGWDKLKRYVFSSSKQLIGIQSCG